MIKSRRKLKARKVTDTKVYDPMPRGPKCAPRSRATTGVRDERTYNVIALNASGRKVRTFKSGKRRITF